MIRRLKIFAENRWVFLVAIIVLLQVGAQEQMMGLIGPLYDKIYPIVVMQGEVVVRDPNSVVVHIWGKKQRDCKYLRIDGYTVSADGRLADVYEKRIDIPADGETKPKGVFDIGFWLLSPIPQGTKSVQVWVAHECTGRLVTTKIADVNL